MFSAGEAGDSTYVNLCDLKNEWTEPASARGPIEEIRPGDVVWFASDEKHWHGAASTTGMMHVAIQEKLDGKVVE